DSCATSDRAVSDLDPSDVEILLRALSSAIARSLRMLERLAGRAEGSPTRLHLHRSLGRHLTSPS
ncbi:MAG: hypothetical protein AAFP84_19210, partial [Actinomycetota bacterium]